MKNPLEENAIFLEQHVKQGINVCVMKDMQVHCAIHVPKDFMFTKVQQDHLLM